MRLFDMIAPLYGLFFKFQENHYRKILEKIDSGFDISKFNNILDIGCGTGALCKVLNNKGLRVIGVDTSRGMLNQAKIKTEGESIEFIDIEAGERLPFEDKSFDISIASYVAHGLNSDERIKLYKEMKRVSKEYIIIYDYNKNRGLVTTIVEWLENGDYFNFIENVEIELQSVFKSTKVIDVDKRASWYICNLNF